MGAANHLTSVLILLPLGLSLLLALARRGALGAGELAIGLGCFALGLSSVAYVFWRASHPALVQWPMLGPETVWQHLLGAQYRGYLGHFAPDEVQRRLISAHVYPWLPPVLLALLSAPLTGSRAAPRGWRIAVAIATVLLTAHAFSYGVRDPSPYSLPVLALGLAVLPAGSGGRPGRAPRRGLDRWHRRAGARGGEHRLVADRARTRRELRAIRRIHAPDVDQRAVRRGFRDLGR